jgi:hypothetical protein
MPDPPRFPPKEVREALRAEVRFACPVPGCNSPYLAYHHFDLPWREENHYRLEGMIALCAEHHSKADAGACTTIQLRAFKSRFDNSSSREVRGRFDWMRRDIVVMAGSNYLQNCKTVFRHFGEPFLWFERDEDGYLLLNLGRPRVNDFPLPVIRRNEWTLDGTVLNVESPPHGRILSVSYTDDDYISVEFKEVASADHAQGLFGSRAGNVPSRAARARAPSTSEIWPMPFPAKFLDVCLRMREPDVEVDKRLIRLGSSGTGGGGGFKGFETVFAIGEPIRPGTCFSVTGSLLAAISRDHRVSRVHAPLQAIEQRGE